MLVKTTCVAKQFNFVILYVYGHHKESFTTWKDKITKKKNNNLHFTLDKTSCDENTKPSLHYNLCSNTTMYMYVSWTSRYTIHEVEPRFHHKELGTWDIPRVSHIRKFESTVDFNNLICNRGNFSFPLLEFYCSGNMRKLTLGQTLHALYGHPHFFYFTVFDYQSIQSM